MIFVSRITGAVVLGATLLVGVCLSTWPAQAGFVVTLTEQAGNVEASGSGALDVTGLDLLSVPVPAVFAQISPGGGGTALATGIAIGKETRNVDDLVDLSRIHRMKWRSARSARQF